eukprot:XP_011611176.1 PREDICTED: zinc finger protein 845-like [Takifugu rubripes]
MFEDSEVEDPLSPSLNEKHDEQNSEHRESASPDNTWEVPDIVVIKEEEEGWTVSENNESSDGGKVDLCGEKTRVSEESSGPSSREGSETTVREKPTVSHKCGRLRGNGTVHQSSYTICEKTFVHKKNNTSNQRSTTDFSDAQEQNPEVKRSTDAEPNGTKLSALYQTDSCKQEPLISQGPKLASTSEDQTPHVTVRLQDGEEEEEQEEEICGLINSDGKVVEWERNNPGQSPDCTQSLQHNEQESSRSQLQQRDSCSPTLIMEVVEVEKEPREEAEENERASKVAAFSSSRSGKRQRKNKKVPEVTVVLLDANDTEKSANPVQHRGRRKSSEVPNVPREDLEAEAVPRRTRRRTHPPALVETDSPTAGKRPYRRRKGTKSFAEEQEESASVSSVKKRPGRKMVCVPVNIPPELLKKPKEKIRYHCSVCSKEFPHAYKLERHELIHTGEKPYSCSICGRRFNQKGNLKTHYKVHFGHKGGVDIAREFKPDESHLSEYLKSLPGESKIKSTLHCLECGKKCESQSALQAHHVTTHTKKTGEAEAAECRSASLVFCRRCGAQFTDKEKLEEHMKTHIKEKRYSCPDCGKKFINESYIQVHQRIHTGEKPFLCSECGRGFHTASSLKLHEMRHSGERPYACSICGKTFRINSYLTAHYQTHIKDRPFVCSVCGKGYSRAEELKVHHRLHTGERPYECGQCGKRFIYRQGLRQHQRTHGGRRIGPTRQLGRPKQEARLDIMDSENPEEFDPAPIPAEDDQQEIGGLINSDGEEVDFSHLRGRAVPDIPPAETPTKTFEGENEKPPSLHCCSVCGKDFPYASKLQRHLRTHSGERPFPCSMCEKRFPEKGLLMIHERKVCQPGRAQLHRRTHTGERPYHCSICLKSFSRHWHLKTHLEAMHAEVVAGFTRKKFPCSDCDKSCNSAAELRDHQRTHTGERPYQCSYCDKRFALSGTLVRHERLHTGITPYHCSDCGKTFAQQWTLTTHMRTHTGEKPYSCTQCDKAFVAPGELRRHTRIHTGEKPYTCAGCGRHFSLAGTLRNHRRSCVQNKKESIAGGVSDPVGAGADLPSRRGGDVSPEEFSEPPSSETLSCESKEKESEDRLEKVAPSPHMNVIVKEEEEEEPLCEEAKDPVSKPTGTKGSNVPPEPDRQQQETTEIRITVKEEEDDALKVHEEDPKHVPNNGREVAPASPAQKLLNDNQTKRSYSCGLCGRDCHKMSALQIHMRIHSGEKPYQCSLCGKQFTQKGQLKGHQKVHTGEKPFSCPDCGKTFAHSGAMNRHRLTHTGERPYHCSVCDRSFNQSGRLREHEKIHSGEKYDCPECEKSFTRASSLKNHFRLHTGERPYRCDICGRGFSRSQSLRLHRRKHLQIQTDEDSEYSTKNDDLSMSDNNSPINMCITDKSN